MKSLPEIVDDMQTLAAFQMDLAREINEMVRFFGGVSAPVAGVPPRPPAPPPPPAPVATAPPPAPVSRLLEPQVHWTPGREPYVSEAPEQEREPETDKPVRKKAETGSRPLSTDEKAAIRKDWESIPKHLRTADNRRALASKWQCSGQQVFALVREDGHTMAMTLIASRKEASARRIAEATRQS